MWFLIFLFTPLALLLASPSTVVTENDPLTLVDGVSVITGDFYLGEEDYSVAGAEPISIRRFYLSAVGGIDQYAHLTATFLVDVNQLIVNEPNGTQVVYSGDPGNRPRGPIGDQFYSKKRDYLIYRPIDFANKSPGMTNTSTGTISAKSQLKNQTIIFDPGVNKKGKSFTLYASDGTVRRYFNYEAQEKSDMGPYGKGYGVYYYKLVSEALPNGRLVHYEWDHENCFFAMRTSNSQDTKTFARISFPKIDFKKSDQSYSFLGSDGKNLSYVYRKIDKKLLELAQIISPDQADQHIGYSSNRLSQISLPNGRTIGIEYNGSKVSKLLAPIGVDGSMIPYCTFNYDEGAKTSNSEDALGNKTVYSWNNDYRLTQIERFKGDKKEVNRETFVWDGINLTGKVFYNETNSPLFAKTLRYDPKGNILEEILWGNISGRGPPLHINSDGMPIDDGVEKAVTKNTYESRNLLETRTDPSGLITEYTYLSHAQLPATKTLSAKGQVFSKTTYSYNTDNTLVREVVEDGTGICKVQEITPRVSEPYIGLPEFILEKYQNPDGSEKLLKKTKLHYTNGALISQKDIYDADNVFQYSLHYKYDPKGRILEETNPIGQTSVSGYDEVGNRIFFKDFSGRQEVFYDYDLINRPIKKIEKGFDGITQEFLYSYDKKHNLESETDPYGNTTFYEHNSSGHKTKTIHPVQQIRNGSVKNATTQTRYDSMGHAILQIDANGNKTTTTHNILGKPTRVIYSDGAAVANTYNLDGTLAIHIDPLGVETHYKYDALGRILEKRTEDAMETFVYDGSVLIEKTNAEGMKTLYCYDEAGRKISEQTAEELVTFTYDPLSRIASRIEGDLITSYKYDLLDRLLVEKKTDIKDQLLQIAEYEYDASGNQIAITEGKNSIERFEYDSLNRQISKTDPLGSVEITQYEMVQNDLNQKVLQKITTDPLGLQTIELFDAQHRKVSVEKRKLKPLLIENTYYDLNGQKTAQEEKIYNPDGSDRTILNQWEYDSRNRLNTLIEGNGSKITKYEYNLRGDKKATIKPDGTTIFYEYNRLGVLTHLFSSDQTVNHQLEVDRLGRLVSFDGITRALDAQGNVLEERFPSGPVIKNRYDEKGRKIECSIPMFDLQIEYQHGPLDLEKVIFQDHEHVYTAYDLAGNLTQETFLGYVGTLSRSYDLAQRPLSLKSAYFTQSVQDYDPLGNILQMDIDGERQTYTYDELYQLTSETGPSSHDYTFDGLYNRLSKDAEPYELNALNQAVSHCVYNLNGNPTQIGSMRLFYDALDRLIRVETADTTQTFIYDYQNRCLSQTTHGEKPLFFLYDGQNEIGSFDEALRDFRVLGRTEKAEIGASVAILMGQSLYVPIHDLQGNVSTLISLHESPISKYRYSAFGEEKLKGLTISPWRFSSKRVNILTGFVNYGRRYYIPSMGRWLTPDPLGFSAGMNVYAFVHNDPLTHFDEYGLWDYGQWSKEKQNQSQMNFYSSHFAHKIWDEVRPFMSEFMKFQQYFHRTFGPFSLGPLSRKDPMAKGHQFIDRIFGTNMPFYVNERQGLPWQIGVLPSPGLAMIPTANKVVGAVKNFKAPLTAWVDPKKITPNIQVKNIENHWKFPQNPNDLLKDLPRDYKGRIYASDNLRIRPEQHSLKLGDTFNERHHGLHYHVETRRNPNGSWKNSDNILIIKPPNYESGSGTGFLPGEFFPGIE